MESQSVIDDPHKQMYAKQGIKRFGDGAIKALIKDFLQLIDLTVFEGILASELTLEQRRGALHALNLIKMKRNGTIKGRTVADGRKQRDLYSKEETSPSTCHNDSIMMSLLVDTRENDVLQPGMYQVHIYMH